MVNIYEANDVTDVDDLEICCYQHSEQIFPIHVTVYTYIFN
mgnify:CR=1 FL=1